MLSIVRKPLFKGDHHNGCRDADMGSCSGREMGLDSKHSMDQWEFAVQKQGQRDRKLSRGHIRGTGTSYATASTGILLKAGKGESGQITNVGDFP